MTTSFGHTLGRGWRAALALLLLAAPLYFAAGCQYDLTGNPDVSLLTVHVAPDSAVVPLGGSLALTATVTGAMSDPTITWVVEGAGNGTVVGSGLTAIYSAQGINPMRLPPFVRVRAVPNEDPSRYVVCTIYLSIPQYDRPDDTAFVASPMFVRLLSNHTQTFALDTLSTSLPLGPVTWSVLSGPGTIAADGTYTPPATVVDSTIAIVRATLVADTSVHSDATVLLLDARDSLVCFSRDVLPVLSGACGTSGCHDATKHAGGYNFLTYSGTISGIRRAGGLTGARNSRLYKAITQFNASSRMPPPPSPAMTPVQVLTIGRWIDEGALDCQ